MKVRNGRDQLRIVVLGRLFGADAEGAAAALSQLAHTAKITREADRADGWLRLAGQADVTILLQSWPDEFPAPKAHGLVAACGASRLIVCQGAWCASDGRTRAVWPRAVCVSVDKLSARLQFELEVLNGRRAPLPVTAALDEIFAARRG